MSALIGPRQVVFITSRATIELFGKTEAKDDIDLCYWHMPVSVKEGIYAISLSKKKHILELIRKSHVFSILFIPYTLQREAMECTKIHGQFLNKFEALGLTKKESGHLETPHIVEASGFIDCKLLEEKEFEDFVLITAKVINSNLDHNSKRLFHTSGGEYTTTKE